MNKETIGPMVVIIIIAISIIASCLCIYTSNLLSGYNKYRKDANENNCNLYDLSSCITCKQPNDECVEIVENYNNSRFYRHILLLILGILFIVGGLTIVSTNYINAGFSLAGIFVLIYALFEYWDKYEDKHKVCVLFLGLIAVVFGSKHYLNNFRTNNNTI